MTTRTDPWAAVGSRGPAARVGRWSRDHRRVARDSLVHLSQRIGTSLLVWLLIGIALALPAALYLLQTNLALASDQWAGRPGISVYLRVGADAAVGTSLRDELARDAKVARVLLTTADAALTDFQRYSGVNDALEHLGRNPLPASLRVTLKDGVDPAEFDSMATRLRARADVDEVAIEKTWLERVQAMTGVVRRLGWMLAATFALGAVLVTATSVRLAIESQLDELRVMKLVGATDGYVRRPFLYVGLFYGLGGGIVGAMLVSIALALVEAPLSALLGSYGKDLDPAGLDPAFFAGLLAFGAVLGVLGSLLAARQRLADLEVV